MLKMYNGSTAQMPQTLAQNDITSTRWQRSHPGHCDSKFGASVAQEDWRFNPSPLQSVLCQRPLLHLALKCIFCYCIAIGLHLTTYIKTWYCRVSTWRADRCPIRTLPCTSNAIDSTVSFYSHVRIA